MAYFSLPHAGRTVEDVLRMGEPDMYSMGSPVMAATTTLKEISVFPQPLQKPHPQVWEPVTSERSIRWAARHQLNAFTVPEPTSRLKRNIEIYYLTSCKNFEICRIAAVVTIIYGFKLCFSAFFLWRSSK